MVPPTSVLVRGSKPELEARAKMLELFRNSPIPDNEALINIGLYVRATILAKVLYLNELYERILRLPGIIMEFGVWWGANLSLLANFRSVYEPYNWTRKVVGFDTFTGYRSFSDKDHVSDHVAPGTYAVPPDYEKYLAQMLSCHEADNVLSHIPKYELIAGDVTTTVDRYLADNPQTIIALAYFDLALYEPTKKCLEAIRPRLVKGSVLAMDELNSKEFPGETLAYRDVIGLDSFQIYRSRFFPDKSFAVVE
jgi:Macrocin-O-methyltransferase (TylF)